MVKTVTVPRANHFQLHDDDIHPYRSPSGIGGRVLPPSELSWEAQGHFIWKDKDVLDLKNVLFDLIPPRPALGNRIHCQPSSRGRRAQFCVLGALQPGGWFESGGGMWVLGKQDDRLDLILFFLLILTACGFKVCSALRCVSFQQLQ